MGKYIIGFVLCESFQKITPLLSDLEGCVHLCAVYCLDVHRRRQLAKLWQDLCKLSSYIIFESDLAFELTLSKVVSVCLVLCRSYFSCRTHGAASVKLDRWKWRKNRKTWMACKRALGVWVVISLWFASLQVTSDYPDPQLHRLGYI